MTTKLNDMQHILKISFAAFIAISLVACGSSAKETKGELSDKKVQLESLKKQQDEISKKITALEKDIAKLDPNAAAMKPKLVSLSTIGKDTFSHFIDLQGKIDAKNVAYVAPRGQPGSVKAIYVRQGQSVRKGQLILKLDDVVARQQVAAAQQQIAGLESDVKLKQSIYERQQNLWKQNIGSEVQVLQAKTAAEAAASQLSAARANVRLAQETANLSNVYAEMSGVVDELNVRIGETFSGKTGDGKPQITIVNTGDLKVLVQVPENYLGRVKEGSVLEVTLPEAGNKMITTKVSVAGRLIDPNTRSFYVEGKLPQGKEFRPNQIAIVKIKDYADNDAITIPVNTLQNDEKGKYVMVAVKQGNTLVAHKKPVFVGELYGDKLEVRSGLQPGDVLIIDGFQNLYEGQLITTEIK